MLDFEFGQHIRKPKCLYFRDLLEFILQFCSCGFLGA